MKCLTCKVNEQRYDVTYGYSDCASCLDNSTRLHPVEIVPDTLKEDRKKYKDATIQPFRKGHVSKEYLDKYGSKGIKVSQKEIKNAKNVWDAEYYD